MTVERFAICSCPVVVYKNHLLQWQYLMCNYVPMTDWEILWI